MTALIVVSNDHIFTNSQENSPLVQLIIPLVRGQLAIVIGVTSQRRIVARGEQGAFPRQGVFLFCNPLWGFYQSANVDWPTIHDAGFDRVLTSHSVETLISLLLLVARLYIIMALLEYSRRKVFLLLGISIHDRIVKYIFGEKLDFNPNTSTTISDDLSNLTRVSEYFASPAQMAWVDIPWPPIYLIITFAFHPYFGWAVLR